MSVNKTALVIMAAGIGSRYGEGIKQLAKLGPHGEIIMDFSIHDAMEAGFDKVVFIIRKNIEADFREIIGKRIEQKIDCDYAFQEIEALPAGCGVPEGRQKPWGTAHALIQVRGLVDCPFAVINADDYYGKEGFRLLHRYMTEEMDGADGHFMEMCMAGYIVGNTLSDHGSVTRGVCKVGANGYLSEIHETYDIEKRPDGRIFGRDQGKNVVEVDGGAVVSMNLFGLPVAFLDCLWENFPAWLSAHGQELSSEYLLPAEIDKLMQKGRARVKVLEDHDRWFGITYQEDKEPVQRSLCALISEGQYPGFGD